MLEKVTTDTHPNFFLLSYGVDFVVENLVLVPKRFIVPEMIQERKPLGPYARRAGWVGCNLRFSLVPADGMIYCIKTRKIVDQTTVCSQWAKTKFLEHSNVKQRGWLIAVMNCVRSLGSDTFNLPQLYECERDLQTLFPRNRHIKAKIRQQMQVLRDEGWVSFLGHGTYRLER